MKPDQLSQTAAFVAIKFYGLSRIPRFQSLFDASVIDFYDRLVRSLPAPFCYYHYWLRLGWVRRLYMWSEELLLPGDLLHVVGRKWHLQQMTQQLVDEGYEQLVVLGGGFDHLGYYYSQQGLQCTEIDAPHMARLKQRFLTEEYPSASKPHITGQLLPHDNLAQLLQNSSSIHPQKKTMVVAEGFFDYLKPATVDQILQHIDDYFSHRPALLSTHFALDELPWFYRTVFKNSVRLVNEQLELHASMPQFERMLAKHGWDITQRLDSQQIRNTMQRRSGTNLPMLGGFYLLDIR